MRRFTLLTSALVALFVQVASAQVLIDQIGVNPVDVDTPNAFASQRFEAANAAFSIAACDNFSVSAGPGVQLLTAEAVIRGFGAAFTNNSFANIQNYALEIYTTRAASGVSLTGNAASATIPAASAVLIPYGVTAFQRKVTLNLASLNLNLNAGSYFMAIIPRLDFTGNGQTGIALSAFAGAFPGGLDAYQANPGGGFAFTGPPPGTMTIAPGTNIAYRLNAGPIPEPASLALVGIALVGMTLRRR